jgi:autotransporter-associated beta strand protein
MVRLAITALVLLGLLATAALAEPAINVGAVEVFVNSQWQAVPLFVTGGDAVTGFNLRAQIGDGTGSGAEPIFQGIGYAGSIWNVGSPGYTEMGGPVAEVPQFAQASVALTLPASSVPAAGLVATLMIDTRGFHEAASFSLNLSGTEIGEDSAFILPGGNPLPAMIINGSIHVIAGGIWTGGTSIQWQTPGNWSSAMTPGPTFTAVFDGPPTANQPALTQAEGVKGIILKTAGWNIAADGNRTLTVGAKGLLSAGSGTNTIAPTVNFTASVAIDVGADNTLILAAVTAGDNALEKSGQGTLVFSGANTYGGGTTVSAGTLLVSNASGSGTGAGAVAVGAATLGGTGFINGPVTLTGDSTLSSTGTLTINSTLTIEGLANQLSSGIVVTTGDVTIEPGAVFIINGTLGGGTGDLIVYGTLMGRGTINKSCVIEAGGRLSPGTPSAIETMAQMHVGAAPQNFSFEIAAAAPNYATPANSLNDLVRLTSAAAPFADASGAAPAFLSADTVIDVYFLFAEPAQGEYKAQFFAATDFTDAIADATYQYWRLDPRGTRLYNGNFYSPLDESLVDWSVVPEMATFGGQAASGYITAFTVVPEPATLALVVMGVAGTLLRRRRR